MERQPGQPRSEDSTNALGFDGDLAKLIQDQIMAMTGGAIAPQQIAVAPEVPPTVPISFEDVLDEVDPRDSTAALAMLDWLVRHQRLGRVGVLDGGAGYLFTYQEPKGSSKAGYVPGGTKGDLIVNAVADAQREAGVTPPAGRATLCKQCMSVVIVTPEGGVVLDNPEAEKPEACASNGGGPHDPV